MNKQNVPELPNKASGLKTLDDADLDRVSGGKVSPSAVSGSPSYHAGRPVDSIGDSSDQV
jgi:hypothetical protein